MKKRDQIELYVEKKKDLFIQASDRIWDHPELYFHEFEAAETLSGILKQEGFEVRSGVDNMPTAFVGSFGKGKPVIGILGEFDALPGLSQKAFQDRQEEEAPGGPGHGCGHNALGAGSLAAAVAVKDYMEENGLKGTVRYYGCPAEEAGWGKMFLARDGFFEDVDAAITWHPACVNRVQGSSTLANLCAYFYFSGKSAHAAGAPHLGRSALDACELMNVGVNYLREHITPEARVHYAYQDVGGPAPNVVQSHASLKYFIRAPKIKDALEIAGRIRKIAEGAALMTETGVRMEFPAGMCDFVPNDVVSQVMSDALFEMGAPDFDEEDAAFARRFFDTLSQEDISASIKRAGESYDDPERFRDVALIRELAPYRRVDSCGFGSTDVGDVSYCVPTAQLNVSCYANATPAHSWQITAQGKSPAMHKGLVTAGKVLALAAINLMEQPELLEEAKKEYRKTTGGSYICPVGMDTAPELQGL